MESKYIVVYEKDGIVISQTFNNQKQVLSLTEELEGDFYILRGELMPVSAEIQIQITQGDQ
jgi:hypothetical protein